MSEKETQKPVQSSKTSSKNKKRNILIGSTFVVLLGVIGVLLYIIFKPEPVRSNVVTRDNVETAAQDVKEKVREGMFEMTMNTQWIFPDSSSPSTNAYVSNSEHNNRAFYFDLVLSSNDEVIYSSPTLPVGTKIENITLEKEITAGTHDAVVQYYLLDDAGEQVSSVGASVKLIIEN